MSLSLGVIDFGMMPPLVMTSRLTARMCGAVPSSSFSIIDEKPIGRAGGRPLLIKFGPKIGLN